MTTEHPGKKEVTAPFVRKERDADVERKVRYYGIVEAFRNGKLPSNKQIDVAINSAIQSDAMTKPSPKLSGEGKHLINDLRLVMEQAKLLLLSKNHEESLQKFVYLTSNAQVSADGVNAPISKTEAQRDGDKALESLKTLGMLMITNGQFRKLLTDAGALLQDMSADAVEKAQEKVGISPDKLRPSKEKLDNLDEPAPDNQWHEKPDFEGMKNDAKSKLNQAKDQASNITGQAKNEAAKAKDEAQNSNSNEGAKNAVANRLDSNIPDEHREKAQEMKENAKDTAVQKKEEAKESTKQYLQEKIPEERRDAAIERLKKMVVEIQDHEDYNDAIETILGLAENYKGHTKHLTAEVGKTAQSGANKSDDKLAVATKELKTVIEYFANSTSFDDITDALNDIYEDADNDPKLRKWFEDVDSYIRKVLKQTGYILEDASTEKFNELQERGRDFAENRYKEHFDRLRDEITRFGDEFTKDPQNKKFGDSVQKLLDDLGTDKNGKTVFKKHLVKDVTNVILPGIFHNINYVPVPRIEVIDPKFEVVIENLVLEGRNIIPNLIEITNDNFIKYSALDTINNRNHHKVGIKLSQIQLDLKDIAYYVKKKEGFSISDTGLMDILISGNGLTVDIALETAHKEDRRAFFKPAKVVVNIHHMDVKLTKSKHKLLYSIFRPLLMSVMRPAIGKAAEAIIKKQLEDVDQKLYRVHKQVQREKAKAKKGDPEGAIEDVKKYFNQMRRNMNEKSEKAKEKTANTEVNVAATLDGSHLKNKKLPGVTSGLATEYKQKAREGQDWHNELFTLGSVGPSSNIPEPKPITRKSPWKRATKNASQHPANTDSSKGGIGAGQVVSDGANRAQGSSSGLGGQQATSGTYAYTPTTIPSSAGTADILPGSSNVLGSNSAAYSAGTTGYSSTTGVSSEVYADHGDLAPAIIR